MVPILGLGMFALIGVVAEGGPGGGPVGRPLTLMPDGLPLGTCRGYTGEGGGRPPPVAPFCCCGRKPLPGTNEGGKFPK